MAPGADTGTADAGDIVWIDFGEPLGHEQAGLRPALVVSPKSYNESSSLVLVCPITRSDRPWPFKVRLDTELGSLSGFVLADQVRSVDPSVRILRGGGRAAQSTLAEVIAKLASIFGR